MTWSSKWSIRAGPTTGSTTWAVHFSNVCDGAHGHANPCALIMLSNQSKYWTDLSGKVVEKQVRLLALFDKFNALARGGHVIVLSTRASLALALAVLLVAAPAFATRTHKTTASSHARSGRKLTG